MISVDYLIIKYVNKSVAVPNRFPYDEVRDHLMKVLFIPNEFMWDELTRVHGLGKVSNKMSKVK